MVNAVCLLSSGLDSSIALAMAVKAGVEVRLCITVNYGQKAAKQEIAHAALLAAHFGVAHQVLNLDWMKSFPSGLTSADKEIPQLQAPQLDSATFTLPSAAKVWVPNRNGILIEIAAGFAESLGVAHVITGFNREEAVTFPDNGPEYVKSINQALKYSTGNRVELISPTLEMNKAEIVAWGRKNAFPFSHLWSCYLAQDKMCGQCESCQRLKRALGEEEFLKL